MLSCNTFEAEHQLSHSLLGIIFLGTPHAGSDLPNFALALGDFIKFSAVKSPNTSNIDVLKKDSEVLAGIQKTFQIAIEKRGRLEGRRLEIHCCTEEKPVQILGRVSVLSPWLQSHMLMHYLAYCRASFGGFSGLPHVEYHSSRPYEHD